MNSSLLNRVLDRRAFLSNAAPAITGIALTRLPTRDVFAPPIALGPHHTPKAKEVPHIFCPGGVSHMDLWEHKPALDKMHGQPLPGEETLVSFQGKHGNLMRSPWPFQEFGQSGRKLSSLIPHLGRHAD